MIKKILVFLGLLGVFSGCELNNPTDPLSPFYQGYPTYGKAEQICILEPQGGSEHDFFPLVECCEILDAQKYTARISRNADFSVYDDCDSDSRKIRVAVDLSPGVYYIKASVDGEHWSSVRKINLGALFSAETYPQDEFGSEAAPLLDWVKMAYSYQLRLASSEEELASAETIKTTKSEYQIENEQKLALDSAFYWQLRGRNKDGNYSAWTRPVSYEYRLEAPQLLSPLDTAAARLDFSWEALDWAESYQLQIAEQDDFSTLLLDEIDISGSTFSPEALSLTVGSRYYWRLRARNSYDDWGPWQSSFFDYLLPAPENLSATGNALSWSSVAWAESYEIEVAGSSDFSTLAHSKTDITDTEYTVPLAGLLGGIEYSVRLRASNFQGDKSAWTDSVTFQLPVLADLSATGNALSWSSVAWAESYEIQVSESSDFSGSLVHEASAITENSYTVPEDSLARGTEYYWRLRAKNAVGDWSTWSEGESFRFLVAGDTITVGSGEGAVDFVWVPAGSFMMGSTSGDSDEEPVHQVTLTEGFWMSKYEITQGQWEHYMGSNPASGYGVGSNYPVYNVSWNDIKDGGGFIDTFNSQNGCTADLPTEAQWEYACRAGTSTEYYWGDSFDGDYAIYAGNDPGGTAPVGSKLPNAWGLYDMSGNLWEWCLDWYSSSYYSISPGTDPLGPSTGSERVLRGSSWYSSAGHLRSASRGHYYPSNSGSSSSLGFRLCLSP